MDEAEKIYYALFKKEIPLKLKRHFHEAASRLFTSYSWERKEECRRALVEVTDIEALELAARIHNKLPLLVSKFRLMVYLSETLPQNINYFLNLQDKKFKGKGIVFFSGLRSLIKYIKGIFLLKKIYV